MNQERQKTDAMADSVEDGVVEFTQCDDCGYASASCNDCCMSCGSLNTHKDAIGYKEWIRDY